MAKNQLFIDIAGKKFGYLTALEYLNGLWKCRCDCGKIRVVNSWKLRNGQAISCGCKSRPRGNKAKDITGMRFGKLIAVKFDHAEQNYRKNGITKAGTSHYWVCRCDCGNERVFKKLFLTQGKAVTCGCGRTLDSGKGEVGLNRLYDSYKRNHRRKFKTKFPFSKDRFKELTSQNCFYCGSEPLNMSKSSGRDWSTYYYNGLDRIDNNLPYSEKNVVVSCKKCNLMKYTSTQEEFLQHIKRIYEKHFYKDH